MKNVNILLKDILKLKNDLKDQGMKLSPGLAGMYGDFLVFQKMQKL